MAAVALAPQPALAQAAPGAFRGTPTTGMRHRQPQPTAPPTETITVNGSTATINWAPFDTSDRTTTPIDFLPAANIATFTSGAGVADYTVLNRIIPVDPNRAIALNGKSSRRFRAGRPSAARSGSTARRNPRWRDRRHRRRQSAPHDRRPDQLDARPPTASTQPSAADGDHPNSKIQISAGAQLKALQQNSYIALVAPRIEQAGSVTVNGSAAYVAAEQVTLTMNQGLFDIQVPLGGGTDRCERHRSYRHHRRPGE